MYIDIKIIHGLDLILYKNFKYCLCQQIKTKTTEGRVLFPINIITPSLLEFNKHTKTI